MQLDEVARDVEAEAQTAMRPCVANFCLTEGFEDVGQKAGIDAPAVIPNGDPGDACDPLQAHLDCSAARRELYGVREQVAHDLLQALGVPDA